MRTADGNSMTTARLTFLIVTLWLAAVIILVWTILTIATFARAADMTDCHAYANRGSAAALRQLLDLPFIDASAGRFLYRRAYTYCLNSDEVPSMTFTVEEQPIVDGAIPIPREKPPGLVPATDPSAITEKAPSNLRPKVNPKVTPAKGEALCISHGRRTVYNGLHWRCVP